MIRFFINCLLLVSLLANAPGCQHPIFCN